VRFQVPMTGRVKDDVMRPAVLAKFTAYPASRAILLDTDDTEIVEDSSTDHYRGRVAAEPAGICSVGS
jgi:predicted NAD-dependent protein-ADP-ribosyltransferase YbiA (DUF1768 family)